jgi:hypothetical protein
MCQMGGGGMAAGQAFVYLMFTINLAGGQLSPEG